MPVVDGRDDHRVELAAELGVAPSLSSGPLGRLVFLEIVAVRRDGRAAMAGDGQVSLGQTVMKSGARKVLVSAPVYTPEELARQKVDYAAHTIARGGALTAFLSIG